MPNYRRALMRGGTCFFTVNPRNRHFDYIHINPVKHGHVQRARDWPYSSFHQAVRDGLYPADWGGDGSADDAIRWGE